MLDFSEIYLKNAIKIRKQFLMRAKSFCKSINKNICTFPTYLTVTDDGILKSSLNNNNIGDVSDFYIKEESPKLCKHYCMIVYTINIDDNIEYFEIKPKQFLFNVFACKKNLIIENLQIYSNDIEFEPENDYEQKEETKPPQKKKKHIKHKKINKKNENEIKTTKKHKIEKSKHKKIVNKKKTTKRIKKTVKPKIFEKFRTTQTAREAKTKLPTKKTTKIKRTTIKTTKAAITTTKFFTIPTTTRELTTRILFLEKVPDDANTLYYSLATKIFALIIILSVKLV